MKALILAAGKGTRMAHLTDCCPKPMLPVNGQPLLEQIVIQLCQHGITQIGMNLHHLPHVITNHFGSGARFGVEIVYSHEETLLGTAGAAKRLQSFLDEPFIVVYGDVFTNINLSRLMNFHSVQKKHSSSQVAATIALYSVPNPTQCGLVDVTEDGRVTRFVEKPAPCDVFTDLANAGILVADPEILSFVPSLQVFDFGRDLFPLLLAERVPLFGQSIESDEYLIDIGTPSGYERAQQTAYHPAG